MCALVALSACGPGSGADSPAGKKSESAASASRTPATGTASAASAAPAAAAVAGDPAALAAGADLEAQTSLEQAGGYRLLMQADGDLVLTWGSAVLWSTGTGGHPGARAVIQPGGDFVVAAPDGAVLWSAGTAGRGAIQVRLSLTGELVVADGAGPVWTAGSDGHRGRIQSVPSPSGAHELVMQDDGNLVLYASGSPAWATRTEGRTGAIAELRPDGDLVVGVPGEQALWSAGTAGSGATELVVSDDGTLQLVTATGTRVWQATAPVAPVAPVAPAAPVAPPAGGSPVAPRAPAAAPGGAPVAPAAPPAASEPPPAVAPVSSDYGLAGSLIAEINAYRQANGLGALQVSGQLNGYAQACAADMAAVDAPLAHCRSGEIVQYNTFGSPHAWLVAYQNSPSHNAIMLLPDITYIGGGVSLSPGGRYYSVINVS